MPPSVPTEDPSSGAPLFERLRGALRDRPVGLRAELPSGGPPPRAAAVLVPLFVYAGQPRLLLTRRTDGLSQHPGQIAFPGGSRDAADPDLRTTALREAEEELGLRREDVDLLGPLDLCDTITGFRVAPWVGVIPWPYPLRPEEAEVAEVLSLPLAGFLDPGALRIDRLHVLGLWREVVDYTVDGRRVWGATGRITHQLVEQLRPLLVR